MEKPQEQIIKRAKEVHPGSLSPESFENILQLGAEFAATQADVRVFVLGNYSNKKRERLADTVDIIDNNDEVDATGFQMTDFLQGDGELNGILKYRLIADYADHIFMVCEDSEGGAAIEQGMLAVLPTHLQKSHLYKREYAADDLEHQRYSWMQSQGIFEIYEETNRLRKWQTPEELEEEVEQMLQELS